MSNLSYAFSDYCLNTAQKPAVTAQCGTVVIRRTSPVLSKAELQRLILDMVG
jgi:hypothetical protein